MIWIVAAVAVGICIIDPLLALAAGGLVALIVGVALIAERGIGRNP